MGGIAVSLRPVIPQELELLEKYMAFGSLDKHRDRLAAQGKGQAVYLVAWHGNLPIGHALLKWDGAPEDPMASSLHNCPDVEDLFVSPDYRARGVGSQLLDVAEDLVKQKGHSQLGMSVGIQNTTARSLYERRGYVDSGLGKYRIGGSHTDRCGRQQTWEETCVYLIKDLK